MARTSRTHVTKSCLRPDCKSAARCRGLCMVCYNVARRLMNLGKVTEDDLIATGRILPLQESGSEQARLWLMESGGKAND